MEKYSDIRNLEYVIDRAKSQVVSGIIYYLKIEYPKQRLFCDFEVTYQSWIDEYLFVFQAFFYLDAFYTGGMTMQWQKLQFNLIKLMKNY